MKKLVTIALAAALAVPAFAQTSAPARFAVINVQKVLAESAAGKSASERLQKMQEERRGKAVKMNEEIASIETQFNQKKLSLSEEKAKEMEKQASDKKIALQRFAQDAEREMTEARERALQDLEKQILPVITSIGKEMGFAAIFNKFESGLVYASDAIDITEVVVKRFNETTGTAAPAAAKK